MLDIIMQNPSRASMFQRSRLRKLSSRSLPRGTGLAPRRYGSMRGWVIDPVSTQPGDQATRELSPSCDAGESDAI
jgi:hypothetical protein